MNEKTKQPAGREAVNAALRQLMSEGVEVNTGGGTEGEEEISLAEKVREAYEGSIEYRLGCQIMDGLTQGYALTSDDAEAMLTGEYAPKSSEIVGARAAETLKRMEKEGRLARGIESYLADGEFLQMLRQMPAELAIRIKEAEWAAEGAKNARSAGARAASHPDTAAALGRGGRDHRPPRRRARRDRKAEGPSSAAHAHEDDYTRERGAGLFNHEQRRICPLQAAQVRTVNKKQTIMTKKKGITNYEHH